MKHAMVKLILQLLSWEQEEFHAAVSCWGLVSKHNNNTQFKQAITKDSVYVHDSETKTYFLSASQLVFHVKRRFCKIGAFPKTILLILLFVKVLSIMSMLLQFKQLIRDCNVDVFWQARDAVRRNSYGYR